MTDMTVANGHGSDQAELIAELARLRAENQALKSARIHCKVGDKGNLCIYGLGRFPVSLYLSQFQALDAAWNTIVRPFVQAHMDEFATKE